jgi:Meiotically up-regulated gene 113
MIYFVQAPNLLIKIGTSIRLTERLKKLTAAHGERLLVLAVTDGGFDVEQNIHARFAARRFSGEWFHPHPELTDFMALEGRPWNGRDEIPANQPGYPGGNKKRRTKRSWIRR